MGQYVIGVDGGGTKTQCALFDLEGNKIDLIKWGPLNHEVLSGGFEEFHSELEKLLNYILGKNGIEVKDIEKGVFGLAGVDTKDQYSVISEILSKTGIKSSILCNDAFLGIKAGCVNGYGICVINGTGCSVAGINRQGDMFQIGGQGALTGDRGGGSMIGEAAIRSVYNYFFRCGKKTIMKDLLFERLGIDDKYAFMDEITRRLMDKSLYIADVNKFVFDAANMGDEVACEILREVGRELGLSANGMIKEMQFEENEDIEVILAGSVNVKGDNPSLIHSLKEQVLQNTERRNINFIVLDKPPVAGAIMWAFENNTDKNEMFNKIMKQF